MAYAYKRSETVQASQVTGTLTNFPALFSRTHADFKTVANGGHVQNANGYDLNLFADNAGVPGAMIDTETLKYDAATGEVIKFARVGSIAVGTVVWWQYGDSGISTSQDNATGVWNSDYALVLHLGDGSTLSLNDSTANANNGTGTNTPTATAGQVGGGMALNGSTQYATLGADPWATQLTSYSASAWVKPSSTTGAGYVWSWRNYDDGNLWLHLDRNGADYRAIVGDNTTVIVVTAAGSAAASTWAHLVQVRSGSTVLLYVNGSPTSDSGTFGDITVRSGVRPRLGSQSEAADAWWGGTVDEARISLVALSAAWIAAEFNNQNAPTTFWGLGSESAVGGAVPFQPLRRGQAVQRAAYF